MIKNYFLTLLALCTLAVQGQDLIITGVFDGPLSGGTPKAIELYVVQDIADLSNYGVGAANNGGGTDNVEFVLEGPASAGDFLYIASETEQFAAYFGFAPTFNGDQAAGINGDDAVELFADVVDDGSGTITGTVIDVFGEIDTDGSGEPWEYADGWAYRNNGTGPDGSTFVEDSWTFSGVDVNDGQTTNDTATTPWPLGTYEAANPVTITFDDELTQANEASATIEIPVTLSAAAAVTTDVSIVYTSNPDANYTLDTTSLTFAADGTTTQSVSVTLNDNDAQNNDFVVVLGFGNLEGASAGEIVQHSVFVLDDEAHAPAATNALGMTFNNSLEVDGAEIVTYDSGSQKLFVSNSGGNAVEVINYADPTAPVIETSIDMTSFGEEVTSVSAFDGTIAIAVKAANQDNGRVVFVDSDGTVLSDVEVGSLPDMVTFTPNGTKVLVANEGEPNDEYTNDPEGSVSIIDVSTGFDTPTVTTADFTAFNDQQAALTAAGVRIFGPGANVAQDIEPEFITVSNDETTAYVSLQENNAYAVLDLETNQITDVISYGYKDHSLEQNAIDATNRLDFVFMSTWNTLGMYQPDAIATYTIGDTEYLVIANEGDARDYNGYSEEERVKDLALDPTAYPDAAILQQDEFLGRLKTTSATGDTDGDGDIDQIYSYGGRSFAILNASTGDLVYDSGDLLERITKEDPTYGAIFNATDDENSFKNRSDDKGPEPEAVTLAQIQDEWYAFVGLERIGGIAVFNVTDPTAPTFETYVNNRDTTPDVENPEGDLAPEGVIYIAPEDNATGRGVLVVANEVSSTVSTYILDNVLNVDSFNTNKLEIIAYPNPSFGILKFSQPATFSVFDILGRKVAEGNKRTSIDISNQSPGMYIIKYENGQLQKIIKN